MTGCLARLLAEIDSDLTFYDLAPRIGLLGPTFDADEQKVLLDAIVRRIARDSDMSNLSTIKLRKVSPTERVAA
jgi:hypothetical protein